MMIGSGDLLPGVAENHTFPILSALAYTTGLTTAQPVTTIIKTGLLASVAACVALVLPS